jgi:CheY-like chemotaxis protein
VISPTSSPRVLVVEDEPLIGLLLKDMLEDLGYAMIGPIALYEEALAAAREAEFEIAILDLNIQGKSAAPIADALAAKDISYIFATGNNTRLPAGHSHVRTLAKPFRTEELGHALKECWANFEAGAGVALK